MRLASYKSPKTEVRSSAMVGRGLFARTAIERGEIVCVKAGHLLTKDALEAHRNVVNRAELQISDDLFLAPASEREFGDVMMFLNHSCEPNVGVQGQVIFVAMRSIAAGEELTLDYGTIHANTESMACRCGTRGCRQIITGQDWSQPELQEKYGDYFSWYLLEKIKNSLIKRTGSKPTSAA